MSIFPFNNNKLESNTLSSYTYTTTIEDNKEDNEEDNEKDNKINDTFEVTLKPNLGLTNNIFYIRKYLDKIGILDASDVELYEAWSMFSKEQYDKNFLLPESIYLNDFADWLNDREEI